MDPETKASAHSGIPPSGPVILPAPHYGRWFGIVLVAFVAAWVIYQVLVNSGFQWDVVGRYMLHRDVLAGVVLTLELTALVMAIGTVVGIGVAVMRLSSDPVLMACGHAFVWFFRGTPVLVQLVFWYNLAALFPILSLGIPFNGPKILEVSSTAAIGSLTAAMLGFGLNEAAYMAEIIRAGLLSVDPGQTEASKALGHHPLQTFRVIVLPQAMKAIVPPTGNQVIGMLKATSLASVVALHELMNSVENIYSRTFETVPMLIVAAIWYLILVSLLSIVQVFIERYYSRDGHPPSTFRRDRMSVAHHEHGDEPFVRIVDVWKERGGNAVLKGVNLEARRGEVVSLLGPSGAGKSTLLRCVNALEPSDRGLIYVDGVLIGCRERDGVYYRISERALSRQRAEIGMVFQNFNLFPHMSVLDNITDAPIRVCGESQSSARERALELLDRVGLPDKVSSYPRHLSGGQQQRIAIARALAMRPKLMLFDEPTSSLDPHLVGEVLEVIKRLAATGMTMMIVTHEVQFAREVSDIVAVMADGVIAECGPPSEVLAAPQDPRARAFLARSLRLAF